MTRSAASAGEVLCRKPIVGVRDCARATWPRRCRIREQQETRAGSFDYLVGGHKPAVADHIDGQDSCKFAVDALLAHGPLYEG